MIISLFIIPGCKDQETNKAKIEIKSTTQASAKVKISFLNALDQVTISESKTDSTGFCSFDVALDKPMLSLIQIGNKYGEIYLSPGYDLHIEEVGQDYKIPLKFSGTGAEINNYISWVNANVEIVRWANGQSPNELEYDKFLHRFDSLKTIVSNFHNSHGDTVHLTNEAISLLKNKNEIKFWAAAQEFKFYKLNNSINEMREAQKNGQEYTKAKVPKEFENLVSEVPFNPAFLTNYSADYQMLLNFFWQNKINLPVSEDLIISKASWDLAPLMTNTLIKKGNYPEPIREFLIVLDLKYWFAAYGITPETDSVFADFKTNYQKSGYLPALNKIYNEWLAVAPGKPAPDLEGNTTDGRKISIKDLKGKVVYIDIWATWCGPCVAEIPASKKLQQEFSNETNIQFLSVSIDHNKADWEKFIKKENDWKGLHIIMDPDKIQSLNTSYKLFGVPDYILIDHLGNIVNMKAPRPSEEKIKSEIRRLLDNM